MNARFIEIKAVLASRWDIALLFLLFAALYAGIAWAVCGGETWWIIDVINGTNVFYGDDAYRFFLARSAWTDVSLYTYNFVLPAALVLDGVVTTITSGDLFLSRAVHGLLGALALCFVWDCGRQLGISRIIMALSVLVMGLIPRYAFTTLSFYGEFWIGFFVCILLWLFVSRHFMIASLVAGVLPLIRPEGIYFLAFLWVFMVKERRFKEAAIMVAPGFIYFVFLLVSLPSLLEYSLWRAELRRILGRLVLNKSNWDILSTYTWSLLLPAILGVLFRPVRRLWPVILPAVLWIVVLQGMVIAGVATYEERYTYVFIPVLVVLWASFFAWAWEKASFLVSSIYLRGGLVVAFSLMVIVGGIAQLTMLDLKIKQNGARWVIGRMFDGEWDKVFIHHGYEAMSARRLIAEKIELLLAQDNGIDKLVIFDPFLYYSIDPEMIPSHVTVGYPGVTYMVFHLVLNGQVFIQHSGGRMYSYLRYGKPDFSMGERRALYVDLMPLKEYPYTWKWSGIYYELYLFSYLESFSPEVDVEKVPMVHMSDVQRAYRQWLDY